MPMNHKVKTGTARQRDRSVIEVRRVRNKLMLDRALATNMGPRAWRGWKAAAAEKFIQMATKAAARMEVQRLDLRGDFLAVYSIQMPVPRMFRNGELVVGKLALFHLRFQPQWRFARPKGWEPLCVLDPSDLFHPNCKPGLFAAVCLGELPPNTPPKEIALRGYHTVALQMLQPDETHPLGILNQEAAEFYRNHPEYVPLTDVGLYEPWDPTPSQVESNRRAFRSPMRD